MLQWRKYLQRLRYWKCRSTRKSMTLMKMISISPSIGSKCSKSTLQVSAFYSRILRLYLVVSRLGHHQCSHPVSLLEFPQRSHLRTPPHNLPHSHRPYPLASPHLIPPQFHLHSRHASRVVNPHNQPVRQLRSQVLSPVQYPLPNLL